ncbi:MarR family winged helix-turn-helix transcriptional regulator [Amycolatopsis vancoresmycina]|uniref:MarR family transcriptional regulator n=1 Tax=Amycolatopsis vancoresmycina DSM 44592 TaxID=1292037 RepID=R1I3U0_9PSEU|nr:MarR family transcriptional regulator [Amycolatopsis vancoresmycina]EOD65144.1 MarR family transcriptional regulator [Amycolatopsis vancoresmycina DSM 44592]
MAVPPPDRPRALLRWPTYLMGHLHRSGVGRIDAALAGSGVSLREFYVLVCIGESGPLSQQRVADRLGLDRSDLVKVLDRLEAAGWVLRERDTEDRRRHLLTLTGAGRATVEHVEEVSSAVTGELLGRLSPGEQETLHRLLLKAFGEA